MSAIERAVIYVDSGSHSLTSNNQPINNNSIKNNYVIKIQIGEEDIYKREVKINVPGSVESDQADSVIDSSGQSSPNSLTPPPPTQHFNPPRRPCNRFGSETSESDTESDISSEYGHHNHINSGCSAAQFARREILGLSRFADAANFKPIKFFPTYEKQPPPFPAPLPPKSISNIKSQSPEFDIEEVYHHNKPTLNVPVEENGYHLEEFKSSSESEDSLFNFGGCKDIFNRNLSERAKTIMSEKGTIRGVKNRVRDGIATFLQCNDSKNYTEKEEGRVVVYVTSMGVVRDTYQRCQKVKKILRNLLIKFDERDCYMNASVQSEIKERLPIEQRKKEVLERNLGRISNSQNKMLDFKDNSTNTVNLPQVFIEGQYLGGVDTIEKLNETGELRKLLQPYKSVSVLTTCENCGGFRMLPCPICNGSKKSVHRNHFTEEFVALKCMHCDTSGLIKCHVCNI